MYRLTVSTTALAAALLVAQQAQAQAAPPPNLVSACSGVSLPQSAIRDILLPVVSGIVTPVQNTVNPILDGLGGLLPVIPPLDLDASDIVDSAAGGQDISLQALNIDGEVVGPDDRCDTQSDSFQLRDPAGIAIGGNRITGLGATGLEATAGEANSIAFGNSATTAPSAAGAIALGTDASVGADATGSVALGRGAQVSAANSVALGAGSVADRGPRLGYAAIGLGTPQNSSGEVSVGTSGGARQITNVAAGSAPTDAVNAGQLAGVAAQIAAVGASAVQYDGQAKTVATLAGAGGTRLTNVKAGALTAISTDAVNGAQLGATNATVAVNTGAISDLADQVATNGAGIAGNAAGIAANTTGIAANAADIAGLAGDVTDLSTTVDGIATRTSANTTAIAGLQTSLTANRAFMTTMRNSVTSNTTAITSLRASVADGAIGPVRYSNADNPTTPNGGTRTNDVTLVGAASGTVGLHNVAAGTIRAGSTDAVNGGQIFALGQAAANAVSYDTDSSGERTNTVTLAGGDPTAAVTVTNVAAAALAEGSTDAVNGGQLYATDQQVAAARTTADAALALGQGAVQYDGEAHDAVTLGGADGVPVALHNLAAGTAPTDAVNVAQLGGRLAGVTSQANAYTDQQVAAGMESAVSQANTYTDRRLGSLDFDLRHVRRGANAGTASALAAAGLPQAYEPGKGMVAFAAGTFKGQSALAFGLSKAMADRHTVVKVGASYDTRGSTGANAGVGYQF